MRRIFLMSSVLFVAPFTFGEMGEVSAQCVATTDCASLGYTEASCPNGGIKCPFGNTWNCKGDGTTKPSCDSSYKYTCTGANQKPGADSCDGKYKSCKCASGYEWKNGVCSKKEIEPILGQCTGYAKNCAIGDILNSDGTCTTNKESGKTPSGVVIYIGGDNCGYVMTASPIQKNIMWSSSSTTTGIGATTNWTVAIKNFDACANTQKIIQQGNSSKYPAAWAAVNYAPSAAPGTKGKWCLPAPGMLNSMYTNLNAVNNTISKLGGTQLTNHNEHIWSSSESYTSAAWVFCATTGANTGGVLERIKHLPYESHTSHTVRPVLAF